MKQASVHDFPNIKECKLFEGTQCDECRSCESEIAKWLISKGVKTVTKRFVNHDDTIVDIEGEQLISTDEIVEKMNELNEENKELKQEIGDLGTAHAEEINKIEDEFYEEILKLEKENEQLKKHIEEHSIDERLLDDLYFNQVGGI